MLTELRMLMLRNPRKEVAAVYVTNNCIDDTLALMALTLGSPLESLEGEQADLLH